MTNIQPRKAKVVLIGKIPPPVGGVTIHVDRLIHQARKSMPIDFIPISIPSLVKLPYSLAVYKVIHLHASNPYLQALIAVLCGLMNKPLILTIHRDFGALHSKAAKFAERVAVKYAAKTIVLNQTSYELASNISARCEIISSFIPPVMEREPKFSQEELSSIEELKSRSEMTFCTNAYKRCEDTLGVELYGIEECVEVFRNQPTLGLIILDPSETYQEYFSTQNTELPDNVLLFTGMHSFYRLVELCDGTIRNTSTDGDSLSVKESLYLEKITLATDVVSRPEGTISYHRGQLENCLSAVINGQYIHHSNNVLDGSIRLMEIYKGYL